MMSGSTQKATKNPLTLRQRQDRLPGTSISVRFLLARRRGGLGSIATQNAEQSCSTGSNDARSLILVRVPVWIGMLLVYETIIVLSLPLISFVGHQRPTLSWRGHKKVTKHTLNRPRLHRKIFVVGFEIQSKSKFTQPGPSGTNETTVCFWSFKHQYKSRYGHHDRDYKL